MRFTRSARSVYVIGRPSPELTVTVPSTLSESAGTLLQSTRSTTFCSVAPTVPPVSLATIHGALVSHGELHRRFAAIEQRQRPRLGFENVSIVPSENPNRPPARENVASSALTPSDPASGTWIQLTAGITFAGGSFHAV